MYRVLTEITFTQQPAPEFPSRNGTIIYKFCNEFEVTSGWDILTDDGTITLPRNVYITDKTGRRFSLGGSNVNVGGFSDSDPVFLRGDTVTIKWGYAYYDKRGNEISPIQTLFQGYISGVTSKKPFVLNVEDNMWILKQKQAVGDGGKTFFPAKSYTVEKMLSEMLSAAGLSFKVNNDTNTTCGDFYTQNETIAQVLARLKKDYNFKSYFRVNELRVGSKVYVEQDAVDDGRKLFKFQQNIISDSLEYQRKEDVTISTVAVTTDEEATGKTTKDGHAKTQKVKREVLITFANGSNNPTYYVASKENPIPPNTGGQRFTDTFPRGTSLEKMKEMATENLRRRYYTGMKGKFTTFGIPFVRHGDNVDLIDAILPERNGRYKVKSVKYTGGINGLRQEIELDYLIARLDESENVIQIN
jgi:hypothetical protein